MPVNAADRPRLPGALLFWILLVADIGLLVLAAVGWLTAYIHPRFFWFTEFLGVALPYIFPVLVVATLIVGLRRNYLLLALHVVLVVLIAGRVIALERMMNRAIAAPEDLVLVTYNLPEQWGPRMPEKTRRIMEFVREVNPDLVILQESFIEFHPNRTWARPYVAAFLDSLRYETISHSPGQSASTRLPVFGRMRLLEQEHMELMALGAIPGRSAVVRTRFVWQGREAVVYNLHLRSFGREKPWRDERRPWISRTFWRPYWHQYRSSILARAEEVEQIRRMIDAEDVPVIVAGDLNSTADTWAFRHISSGLQDTFGKAGRGWGKTYHSRYPLVRIDHILVGPEFEVVEAYVANPELSDHRPVVARIRWRDSS
jgi:endonuclease/exonuclease/phosphatase family metal-dependent hydrolase